MNWLNNLFDKNDRYGSWQSAFGVKNEQHRQTATQSKSSAAQPSGNGAGGASAGNSLAQGTAYACKACGSLARVHHYSAIVCDHCYLQQVAMQNAYQGARAQQAGMQNAYYSSLSNQAVQQMQYYGGIQGPPHSPTDLKTEAIIAGELIGWRMWYVENLKLRSVTANTCWEPGETMSGDAIAGYGVHSYKTLSDMIRDAVSHISFLAFGEIELWGDVIEHENGYRSEFASVKSIYYPSNSETEAKLREVYKL